MKLSNIALPASALAIALALAGCTTNEMPYDMPGMNHGPSSSSTEFNDADVAFLTEMIPHHQQAVEMAEIVLAKQGIDERVVDLARAIQGAQAPEIEAMTSWLDDWGNPMGTGMDGMDHGSGMMSEVDMAALETAEGDEASRLFLQQMIEHHEGAIDMAIAETATGENPDALALAQTIADAQTAEIAIMQDILETL